jgi:hypothetical protein
MKARVAFTIEGRTDETQPEMVFGCADLHNFDIVECARWSERGSAIIDDSDDDDTLPAGGPSLNKYASTGSMPSEGSPSLSPGPTRRFTGTR